MSGAVILALPTPALGSLRRRPRPALPFPLGEDGCRLFSRGRHALYQAMTDLVEPGGEVLAPAYHHGSEIEALARAGLTCRFYDATATLAPDESELATLLSARTRALLLIHNLGFPQDARRWRRWCDDHDLLLVEDAAPAWLATAAGRPVGSDGHVAVFCLYKTFGIPDGAALLVRDALPRTDRAVPRGSLGMTVLARELALWLATRSRAVARLTDRVPPATGAPEAMFRLGEPAGPSRATLVALPRVVDGNAAEVRREHYRRYLELLPGRVAPPFQELPEGASPLAFPAVSDDKPAMLARLRRHRIRPLDLWAEPHPSLPAARFPRAMELRRRIVGLPTHQELRPGELERVVEAVRASVGE